MRRSSLFVIPLLLAATIAPETGQAQLIDIRPGYVRLPGLRVQRRRGRFRRRLQPRYYEHGNQPVYEQPQQAPDGNPLSPPPVPPADSPETSETPANPASPPPAEPVDWRRLRKDVRTAEAEFEQQLADVPDGEQYRRSLRVGRLRQLLLETATTPPTGQTRRELEQIRDVYNRTLIDPQHRPISRLSGFEDVQAGLMRLLRPAGPQTPDHVSVERSPAPRQYQPVPTEPQPTQVLPSVRESR